MPRPLTLLTVHTTLVLIVGLAGGAWTAVVAVLLISAICVGLGMHLGIEATQSRIKPHLARTIRELEEARAELASQEDTNTRLRAARDRARRDARLAAELAESHLARALAAEKLLAATGEVASGG